MTPPLRRIASFAASLAATLVAYALVAPSVAAQAPRNGPAGEPPLVLARSAAQISADGEVGEAEWAGAVVGMMHLPDFGAEPTERTEFLLAYDDDYLYFARRAYDADQSPPTPISRRSRAVDQRVNFSLVFPRSAAFSRSAPRSSRCRSETRSCFTRATSHEVVEQERTFLVKYARTFTLGF